MVHHSFTNTMKKECQLLGNCGFIRKYQATKALACKGFITQYCKGERMSQCQRMKFNKENGAPPSDDMMPNGAYIQP